MLRHLVADQVPILIIAIINQAILGEGSLTHRMGRAEQVIFPADEVHHAGKGGMFRVRQDDRTIRAVIHRHFEASGINAVESEIRGLHG